MVGITGLFPGPAAVEKFRAEGLDVNLLIIDVADDTSVIKAARTLTEHTTHLDILINNAGVALNLKSLPSHESLDAIRETYETNTFGPIRVTQAFLPLLKAASQARIIMLSSIVGSIGLSSDPDLIYGQVHFMGYSSSKAALNMITAAFAKELGPSGIKVYAVEPGHIRTDLNDNTGSLTKEEGAAVPIRYATINLDVSNGGFFGPEGILPW